MEERREESIVIVKLEGLDLIDVKDGRIDFVAVDD